MERVLKQELSSRGFVGVTPARSSVMRAIRGKHTRSTETRFRLALVRANFRGWTTHVRELPGSPDFFFHETKVAVFVDGCFWHGCKRCRISVPKVNRRYWSLKLSLNAKRDRRNARLLKGKGIVVIRFWEHELQAGLARCLKRLRGELSSAKSQYGHGS